MGAGAQLGCLILFSKVCRLGDVSEMEHLGLEPVPKWDVSVVGRSLTWFTIMPALQFHENCNSIYL